MRRKTRRCRTGLLHRFVWTAVLIWATGGLQPQAARAFDTNSVGTSETSTPLQDARAVSAGRIRSAVLYGAIEFSTFGRRSPPSARPSRETAHRTLPLEQQVEDRWFAFDKAQHLAFSFLWTLGTQYTVVNKGGLSEYRALPISVTSSALIGVTKEYYDLTAGPTGLFSVRDLVANGVGIVLAVGFILL